MELIIVIIIIAIIWCVIENIIWPLIKLTAQISWYMGIITAIVMVSTGVLFALFVYAKISLGNANSTGETVFQEKVYE